MDASADTNRTRSKNKNQHPGAVEIATKRKRRTKAEIAADKAAQEAKKQEKERKVDEQIKNIASLEGEMAKKDADADGAHPRSRNDVRMAESDDDAPGPKQKPMAKLAEKPVRPRPRPITKNSQYQAKVPNVADQRDLTTNKGSSTQKSDHHIQADEGDDDAMDMQPKPKPMAKVAEKLVCPHPMLPNVADQHNLTTDKASSTQKSDHIQADGDDDDNDLTDFYTDNPLPKKPRTGLIRSYAVGLIPDTRPAVKSNGDGYEADTDQEMVSETEEKDADDSDSETPKKKKKGDKPKVRNLIQAQRDDLAIPKAQDDMEVCDVERTTAPKTSQIGKIQTWTERVAEANKKFKVPLAVPTSITPTSTTAVRTGTDRTTTSSSAVVTQAAPTTKKRAKFEPKAANSAVSAFLDEDESAERDAALTSPIKGKKRLTTKGMVKEEEPSPLPKRTLGGKKYTNSELPSGAQDNGVWRQVFIPTYVQYLASQNSNDTWTISDDDAIQLMQLIWKYIYGARVPYRIKPRGPVFFLANQRVCEWHSGFGSAALAIVNAFFKEDTNDFGSDNGCKEFADSLLDEFAFLFGSVKETKKKVIRKNVFHGPLVIQTFATHLNYIDGAITVSGLDEPGDAFIALALSAAAVERALTFWRDGHVTLDDVRQGGKSCVIRKSIDPNTGKETKTTEFNQAAWGTATNGYLDSIKANIASRKFDWASFVKAASKFKKPSRHGDSKIASSSRTPAAGQDVRARIADDTDDDSASDAPVGADLT